MLKLKIKSEAKTIMALFSQKARIIFQSWTGTEAFVCDIDSEG